MATKVKCYCFTIQYELISEITGVDCSYEIPDILWDRIVPLLLTISHKEEAGSSKNEQQTGYECYFLYSTNRLSMECTSKKSWCSRTVHDRFQEWRKAGVFKRMSIDGLLEYDKKTGIDWEWQAMDGVITKAPLGGKKDRSKSN